MSSGAPAAAKASKTAVTRPSWIPVVSLPSEKVPAPPSPNWTLEAVSSAPVAQKRSTSLTRSSTGRPRSSRIQGMPARARKRAQNSPAGPMPTTTGRSPAGRRTSGN